MAETIMDGQWLGEYNHMTLIRPPLYPLLLAVNSLTGWPLHIVQQGIYLMSIFLLVAALRTINVARWRTGIVFVLCAFHPGAFYPGMFVATEALYTPAATALLAGCVGMFGRIEGPAGRFIFWVGVLTVSSTVFWFTRPEALWILPFCAVYLGFLLWSCRSRTWTCWVRVLAGFLIPGAAVCSVGNYLTSKNEQYYGVRVVHELNEPNFVDAFRWLTRLAPDSRKPYISVTSEAMEVAYEVSPHFARLKPFLSRQTGGRGWSKHGCEWMGICNELPGGWAVWAIRDAAASVGAHVSATGASAFYGAIARELRQACRSKTLSCSRNPTGNILAPPATLTDIPRMLKSFVRMTVLMLTFGDLVKEPAPLPQVSPALTARYHGITHDQDPARPRQFGETFSLHFIIFKYFQIAGGFLVLAMFAIEGARRWGKLHVGWPGPARKEWTLAICILVFILSRVAVVSYIDSMSFFAQGRYFLVIYPALMALISLAIPSLTRKHKPGRVYT